MHAGLPGVGAPTGPLLAVGGLLVSAAYFFGDGSAYGGVAGVGGLALVFGGAAFAAALAGKLELAHLTRTGVLLVALLAALVLWVGLSVLWSVAPDLSWNYFNRGLAYLAFLGVGVAIGAAVPRALSATAAGLAVLSAAVVAWALAGKVVPNLFPDGARLARLRDPVGYWNALGLIAVTALLLGLWLASRREQRAPLRATAAVLVFTASVTLLLTLSRGSTATAILVTAGFIWLTRERIQAVAALALGVVPAVLVAAWAFSRDGLTGDREPYDERLEAGLQFGVLLVLGGALVAVASWRLLRSEDSLAPRVPLPTRRQGAMVAAGAVVVLALAVVATSGGDPVSWAERAAEDFTSPASAEETRGVGRLPELSSNSRWDWWREAWDIFEAHKLAGSGAGSFAIARRPVRRTAIDAHSPHSVPLQFLAETGLVGFLLFAGAAGAAVAAVAQTVKRSAGAERAAACVLALAALAYILHALVDYDWDFIAVTGPVFLVIGVLVGAGRPAAARPRPVLASAVALATLAALLSVVSPWLATRESEDAYAALDRGDTAAAADAADTARALNPLSLDPLRAAATVAEARGRGQQALELYVDGVELQPENWQSWYDLARFEQAAGLTEAAIRHAEHAAQLDPRNPIIFALIEALHAQPGA